MRRAALIAVAAGCAGVACAPAGRTTPPASTVVAANATVTSVVDGDTIVVDAGGRTEHVRLIGIDTPETVDPNRPVMCFGPEASAETKRLLPPGTPVELVRDPEARDVYGRLLAYVYRATDGLFVNLALAQGGFADALSIAPNTTFADDFRRAVAAARAAHTGLWGACDQFDQPVASSP
jgi:micrococcal nuclease